MEKKARVSRGEAPGELEMWRLRDGSLCFERD